MERSSVRRNANVSLSPTKALKKLLLDTFRLYPRRSLALAVLLVLLAILEALGVALLIPIVEHLGHTPADKMNKFTLYVNNALASLNQKPGLVAYFTLFGVTICFKSLVTYIGKKSAITIRTNYQLLLQAQILDGLLHASGNYLSIQKPGDTANLINNEVERVGRCLFSIHNYLAVALKFASYFSVLFVFSAWLILLVAASSALTILPSMLLNKSLFGSSKESVDNRNQVSSRLIDALKNIFVIKSYNAEKKYSDHFKSELRQLKQSEDKKLLTSQIADILFEPAAFIQISLIVSLGLTLFQFTFPEMLIILFTLRSSLPTLGVLLNSKRTIIEALPAYQQITGLIDESIQAQEQENPLKPVKSFEHSIQVKNLSFSYGQKNVLKSINLDIPKGAMIALVGPSGSGKTTFLKLLLRFIHPKPEHITIDGNDLMKLDLKDWRKLIGIVPQNPTLFRDTIAGNIAITEKQFDLKKLQYALRQSLLQTLVDSLPERELTFIGEGARDLSEGQKQRLALARVLYYNPQILILDEPTSALDAESESSLQKVFDNLKGKKTFVIVAHRLSTIKNCDRIFVFRDGQIIESGSFEQLLDKRGEFFKLAKIQGMRGRP